MRTIFAEYNPKRNSIDVYTSVGYMLRIDCWEAEKDLKTTPGSDCALNPLAIDEPLEYARLYLDGNLLDVSVSQNVYIRTFYRFLIQTLFLIVILLTLYLIFDYPYKYYTFKLFEVQKNTHFTTNIPRLNEP